MNNLESTSESTPYLSAELRACWQGWWLEVCWATITQLL